MNLPRVCLVLFLSTIIVAARAEQTNPPAAVGAATDATPISITSNALPTTITVDGITYSNVQWRTVTPATVSIIHSTGAATLPMEKLPPELQQRFGYDPQKAASVARDANTRETGRQQPAQGVALAGGFAFNIRQYGAAGDGMKLDTSALQQAIDAAADAGGGTVIFPPGRYLSGSLDLKNHVTLQLEEGATLLGSPHRSDYRKVNFHGLLLADQQHNIVICGKGVIDGQ